MDGERDNCQHLCTLVDFAFEMKEKLEEVCDKLANGI